MDFSLSSLHPTFQLPVSLLHQHPSTWSTSRPSHRLAMAAAAHRRLLYASPLPGSGLEESGAAIAWCEGPGRWESELCRSGWLGHLSKLLVLSRRFFDYETCTSLHTPNHVPSQHDDVDDLPFTPGCRIGQGASEVQNDQDHINIAILGNAHTYDAQRRGMSRGHRSSAGRLPGLIHSIAEDNGMPRQGLTFVHSLSHGPETHTTCTGVAFYALFWVDVSNNSNHNDQHQNCARLHSNLSPLDNLTTSTFNFTRPSVNGRGLNKEHTRSYIPQAGNIRIRPTSRHTITILQRPGSRTFSISDSSFPPPLHKRSARSLVPQSECMGLTMGIGSTAEDEMIKEGGQLQSMHLRFHVPWRQNRTGGETSDLARQDEPVAKHESTSLMLRGRPCMPGPNHQAQHFLPDCPQGLPGEVGVLCPMLSLGLPSEGLPEKLVCFGGIGGRSDASQWQSFIWACSSKTEKGDREAHDSRMRAASAVRSVGIAFKPPSCGNTLRACMYLIGSLNGLPQDLFSLLSMLVGVPQVRQEFPRKHEID
ncbi:hypothetical protein ACRALDRAFT_205785 [Sodiomyces alcalophilus JCM 7366]|uniref:uncharacterized protein n=1 Tax=Sodiomyces alcalophilus JCM 7366 TaxID=591952 RepID=UPI0039B679EF